MYRVEHLRPVPVDCSRSTWVTIVGAGGELGWKSIDHCYQYRKADCLPTRVVDLDTNMVCYYLDAAGSRDYGKEQHECIDCGSKHHATGSAHCPVANQDECNE